MLTGDQGSARFNLENDRLGEFLTRLGAQAPMQGIRYAVVPTKLEIGRKWSTTTTGGGWVAGGGSGGGHFVGGGSSSSARTSARLHLSVLDLETRKLVWTGMVTGSASSTLMKATALHEIEDELGQNLLKAVLGQG